MDHLLLTKEILDVGNVNSLVVDSACGAVSFFIGTTRDNFDGKKVLLLEYEAYEPMALKEMKGICLEIRTRWSDIVNIAIFHRTGVVPVSEASVIIAVSSPHRKSSLEAVSFAIEELKRRVPIWKKERYDNHESEWKENKESSIEWTNRRSLNILNCKVDDQDNVSPSLVQICADNQEINRRIQCFVEKKREENDLNNILDYTMCKPYKDSEIPENEDLTESTCARTNSTVIKQEGSKCHLRVQRAANRIGPQLKPDYLLTLDKLMLSKNEKVKQEPFSNLYLKKTPTPVLQHRIESIEDYLCLSLNSMDTKQRLKNIENRLLYLESISPEYKHFLIQNNKNTERPWDATAVICSEQTSLRKRKKYTINDLDEVINQIEQIQ